MANDANVGELAEQAIAQARTGKRRGRVDGGQEQILKMEPVRERMEALVMLYRAQQDAATDLSEAIKETAEASGFNASQIRSKVAAVARDRVAEKRREVEQLSLLFED